MHIRQDLQEAASACGTDALGDRLVCEMPSTSIARTEYDAAHRVLSVWFVASGKRYDYEDVPEDVVSRFRRAFSKGRFFNENIRDRYRYRHVKR